MFSKTIILLVIFLLSILTIQAQQNNENLEQLIQEAIKVSPKIKMLNAKLGIVSSRIAQGTNLPDPVLTLGLMNMPTNTFSFTQEPMTGKMIGLTQSIPFPGGLSAAANVKAVDTLIVNQEITDLKNEIRKDVSNLYYDIELTREKIKFTQMGKQLFEQISEVVKTKYEVSNASFQNLIQTQVQLTRLNDKLEKLYGEENSNSSMLNTLLQRDENSEILTNNIDSINHISLNLNSLVTEASSFRPYLKGIKLAEQKSKFQEAEAEYSYYPNFQLGVQYSQRDYSKLTGMDFTDFLSVVVGITLPLNYGGKNSSKVNEAKYQQMFYQEQYNSSIQTIQQSLNKIIAKLIELEKREAIISKTLLPQAEQSLSTALSDYHVNKIDFVNVVNAENEIINIKMDLAEIRTNYKKNVSELEFLIGTKLPSNDSGDLK
ncbi:MAG: TolC family protein [Ignavibacteriae bacterium]|nr:TolC family protein [Ignavibacteriota bacterium]